MRLHPERVAVFALLVVACSRNSESSPEPKRSEDEARTSRESSADDGLQLRVATFNVSLSGFEASGGLLESLRAGSPQARDIAQVIQINRPDLLLLNEFDHDTRGEALAHFVSDYLGVAQGGAEAIDYPHVWVPPGCNTGELGPVDLDGDGSISLPNDAYGYGNYVGQYCMAVLSKHPIRHTQARTMQRLPWTAMPGALLPEDYYSSEVLAALRLSSKTHADLPIELPGHRVLHFLVSHPTPPVFDGPEDRNGKRNHDEIRLWADYLAGDPAGYIVDDAGVAGGLAEGELFVIAGDQNADPVDGDSVEHAIDQLLDHPRVNAVPVPTSQGGAERGPQPEQRGDPAADTSSFGLRVDYVLPSTGFQVLDAGVFWPAASDPEAARVTASDHRMVWVDLRLVN